MKTNCKYHTKTIQVSSMFTTLFAAACETLISDNQIVLYNAQVFFIIIFHSR